MNKYHKAFLSQFASENIIGLFSRYKGAAKEITESWGMLEAARKFIPGLDDCLVVIVGDGCSPRTGALFAYMTKAEVISIDPAFNMAHWEEHVQKQTAMGFSPKRLRLIMDKLENVEIDCEGKPLLVIWPHSHANMNDGTLNNYSKRHDIAMPCCVQIPPAWMSIPHIVFDDYHVISPRRSIHIWTASAN